MIRNNKNRKTMMKRSVFFLLVSLFPLLVRGQGCMEPKSEEGVNLGGYLQPQYELIQNKDGWKNGFTFNRARLVVMGNVPYDFSYYAMVDFSRFKPQATYLLDAFITYSRFPFAKVTLGQFKPPLSQELNTPCHKLHTIQRSRVVNELALPDRDLGLMVWGSFLDKKVSYNLAVMNGYQRNFFDENPQKDLVGRLLIQPVEMIRFGGSFRRGVTGANSDNLKTRLAAELQIEWKDLLLQAEYIYGKDTGSYTTGGGCDGTPIEIHQGPVERDGMYAMIMYMTPWRLQPVVKYEFYRDDISIADNIDHTITYGINYFFNDWTRLQINYLYRSEKLKEVPNDALLVQLQIEF